MNRRSLPREEGAKGQIYTDLNNNNYETLQRKITHEEERAKGYERKLCCTELEKLQMKTLQEEKKQKHYEIKLASQKERADQNF